MTGKLYCSSCGGALGSSEGSRTEKSHKINRAASWRAARDLARDHATSPHDLKASHVDPKILAKAQQREIRRLSQEARKIQSESDKKTRRILKEKNAALKQARREKDVLEKRLSHSRLSQEKVRNSRRATQERRKGKLPVSNREFIRAPAQERLDLEETRRQMRRVQKLAKAAHGLVQGLALAGEVTGLMKMVVLSRTVHVFPVNPLSAHYPVLFAFVELLRSDPILAYVVGVTAVSLSSRDGVYNYLLTRELMHNSSLNQYRPPRVRADRFDDELIRFHNGPGLELVAYLVRSRRDATPFFLSFCIQHALGREFVNLGVRSMEMALTILTSGWYVVAKALLESTQDIRIGVEDTILARRALLQGGDITASQGTLSRLVLSDWFASAVESWFPNIGPTSRLVLVGLTPAPTPLLASHHDELDIRDLIPHPDAGGFETLNEGVNTREIVTRMEDRSGASHTATDIAQGAAVAVGGIVAGAVGGALTAFLSPVAVLGAGGYTAYAALKDRGNRPNRHNYLMFFNRVPSGGTFSELYHCVACEEEVSTYIGPARIDALSKHYDLAIKQSSDVQRRMVHLRRVTEVFTGVPLGGP